MDKENQHIENLFKNKLKNYKIKSSEDEWMDIELKLMKTNFLKFNPLKFNIYYSALIISTFVLSTFVSVDYFIFSKQDADIKQIENKKPNEARVPEIKALDSTLMPNTRIRKDTLKINTKYPDINKQNVNIESKNEQNNYTRENYQNFDNLTDISDSVVKQNEFIMIKDSSGQKSDSSTKTIYIKNDDIIIRDTVIKYEKRKPRKLFDSRH